MAIEKRKGNTIPMAASSDRSFVRFKVSVNHTVASPTKAAPAISRGEDRSWVRKKARTIPSRIVWVMESDIIDIFLSTRKTPGREQAMATITAISWISNCGDIRITSSVY
jgi:hypothetical protein